MAFLGVILGPMFSAKTSSLIEQLELQAVLGRNILVVSPQMDNRCSDTLFTHSNGRSSPYSVLKLPGLLHVMKLPALANTHVVGVDEGQFFGDLIGGVRALLELGKIVWVAGLSGDIHQRALGDMLHLVPMADEVRCLRALCLQCCDGTPAPFTQRRVGNEGGAVVQIGANDVYEAVCRRHLRGSSSSLEKEREKERESKAQK